MGALERQEGHADRLDAAPMRAGDKLSIAVDQLLIGYGRRGRAVRPAPARIADIIDALEDHDMRNARQGKDVAIEAFHGAWPGAARNDSIARNRLRQREERENRERD